MVVTTAVLAPAVIGFSKLAVESRNLGAVAERQCGKREARRKLRFDAVADKPAIGAHRRAGELCFQKRPFRGRRDHAGPSVPEKTTVCAGSSVSAGFARSRKARLQPAVAAAAAVAADRVDRGIDAGAAGFGIFARFQHQEGADGTEDHSAAVLALARPDRLPVADRLAPGWPPIISMMSRRSAENAPPDQRMCRLSRLDAEATAVSIAEMPAASSPMKVRDDPGHLVHDRDVTGEQVRELGEEQRRAQFGRQLLVEQLLAVVALQRLVDDQRIDIDVALAAAGGHDHVHAAAGVEIVLEAGVVERQACCKHAEALPVFHLALVATLGDLLRPVDLRQRMHRIGLELFGLDALAPAPRPRSETPHAARRRHPGL